MADDIIIKFRADDKNLVKTLKDLVNAQKKLIGQTNKATTAITKASASFKKLETNTKKANTGIVAITGNGRLLNNAFATMRSKLLLVSFAFGLVARGVGKNIETFATQEESVARLALQFGSVAAKELDEYSSGLQKITRFGDENINVVMSQFGAFGANIEQTKKLTMATIDLAEGQGMDLNSAALLVAKSMGSTTNALFRYGIAVDTSASKSVKAAQLVEGISAKYGGLGELLGGLAGSELVQMKKSFSDLTESLGETLAEGLNPIIGAFESLSDAMNGLPVRVLTESIVGLTSAFIGLKVYGIGAGFLKALKTAARRVALTTAMFTASGGAAVKASSKIVLFGRALMGATGGIGLLVTAAGFLITGLIHASGWFGKTKEEAEDGADGIDKFAGTIKNIDIDDGVEKLDKFYKKLIDVNELLKLESQLLSVDLISGFETAFAEDWGKNLGDISKELEFLTGNTGLFKVEDDDWTSPPKHFISDFGMMIDQFDNYEGATDGIIETNRELFVVLNAALKHFQKHTEFLDHDTMRKLLAIEREKESIKTKKDAKKTDEDTLTIQEKLTEAYNKLKVAKAAQLKVDIDAALILLNNGKLEAHHIIALKAMQAEYKKLTAFSGDLTDSQQLQADAYDTLKKAQAGTLQSQIDVLDSQITLLQADGELVNSKGEVITLTELEVEAIQILIDKKKELENQQKKESYTNKLISDERLNQMSQFGNAIATIAGENKALAIAGMRISQFAAVVGAIEGGIELFSKDGDWVSALVATAVALAQVATIEGQIQGAKGVSVSGGSSAGKFAYGGLVGGNRHLDGGTLIEAEQGEFVMSRRAVQSIGLKGLNELNRGGSSGGINVTVTGNVLTQDFVEGELAESIKEAVRRGSDFGIG